MDFNVTSLLIVIMLLVWQLVMWKKIKLKKWQDYTLSAIMIALAGWLVYLTFYHDYNFVEIDSINTTSSPTFIGFFVCGMIVRFIYA